MVGRTSVPVDPLAFPVGTQHELMAETKLAERVLSQGNDGRLVSAIYTHGISLVYSLDVVLPFVDLHQVC